MVTRIFHWLDNNLLTVFAGFLLVFIPLYPKWPLFDVLPGYIVRVRLEDFLVSLAIAFYFLQLFRRKFSLNLSPGSISLLLYLLVGLVSSLVAVLVIKTVPVDFNQVGKTFLHWGRRIEYFSLFFIVFSSIKSNKVAKIFIGLLFLTLIAVILYGFGQKYLYWPAFSTMNREFSKGWWLYLTEHARVLSTFGGHYDLAGYLVITLTLAWSFLFGVKRFWQKAGIGIVLAGGFWLLILTASRISFAGYIIGLTLAVFLWAYKRGLGWAISRWFVTIGLSVLIMLSFGDLSDRFLRLVKLDQRINNIRQALLNPASTAPKNNAAYLENNLAAVASRSDTPPTPARPAEVTGKEPPYFVSTETASGSTVLVEKPRTYSQNAVLYDLSTGIRLDATWPRAIAGFKTNPITGSGYATLTKQSVNEFTEAESTDNDFLRALGETGILGFLTFYGSILLFCWFVFKSLGGIRESWLYSLSVGFIGASIGLLVNALTIDIFVSSKVAYAFWGVAGLTLGSLLVNRERIRASMKPLRLNLSLRETADRFRNFLRRDIFWVALIFILAVALRSYKLDSPVADWHSWRQADTSSVTRNYDKNQSVNWLYPVYDDISSIASGKPNPKGLRMVEFPIYNALSLYVKYVTDTTVEEAGHLTSALASGLSIIFLFLILKGVATRRIAFLAALAYAVMPYAIFYGRVILPDPLMDTLSLGGVYFAYRFSLYRRPLSLIIMAIFASLALLVKPYAIFILAAAGYFFFVNFKFDWKRYLPVAVAFAIAIVPLLLWRWWISQFPEGIPANSWLLNGDGIRFKGAFWYWIFADRIGRLILGYWGVLLLGLGLVRRYTGKYHLFPLVFFLTSISYVFVFATGNVRHDYYQILLIPCLATLVGGGADFLLTKADNINLWVGRAVAVFAYLAMVGFGWYFIRDYYNINHPEIVEAGIAVQKLTDSHQSGLVVAPYDGDTAFLYQTRRKGWPIMQGPIDDMIRNGATYYVSVRFDTTTNDIIKDSWPQGKPLPKGVLKKYTLLEKTDRYVVVQLVPDELLPR